MDKRLTHIMNQDIESGEGSMEPVKLVVNGKLIKEEVPAKVIKTEIGNIYIFKPETPPTEEDYRRNKLAALHCLIGEELRKCNIQKKEYKPKE